MTLDEFRKLLPPGARWIMDGINRSETITGVIITESVYKPEGGMAPDRVLAKSYGVNPGIAMANAIRHMDRVAVGRIAKLTREIGDPGKSVDYTDCGNNLTGGQHFQGG